MFRQNNMYNNSTFSFFFKGVGILIVLAFVFVIGTFIFTLSGGTVPCSLYDNTPVYQTPARCLPHGTPVPAIPVPVGDRR